MLEKLKAEVCKANLDLVAEGLVIQTWGNASAADRKAGIVHPAGLDRENADFDKTLASIQAAFGPACQPVVLPLPDGSGVVDVLAIRKDTKRPDRQLLKSGDLFEIILVQMKGGSARRPNVADTKRLRVVKKRYGATDIVLFTWKRGGGCKFEKLGSGDEWILSSSRELFG